MASKDVIDTLIAEAGGEGDAGLIAAAWAIQQRAAARGQTVDQVIKSGFDGYTNPGSGAKKAQQDSRLRAKVEQIMTGVQNGTIPNPVPGADHFLSGDVSPGWSKNMKLVATIGGHRFYASGDVPQQAYGPLIPPGELPEVATRQDTRRPALPPVPVTPSPQISALRGSSSQRLNYGQGPEGVGLMPTFQGVERFANGGSYGAKNYGIEPRTRSSAEINSTIAGLSRPRAAGNLGDSLAMNPVSGGPQQAPMFDGIYDERINAIRPSGGPINTQGMATMRSSAPAPVPASPYDRVTARLNSLPPVETARQAPVPAMPSPQLAGRRATDPALQAALNYKYPARLPDIPPPSGAGPTTRAVQSVPVRGNVPSGGFAGQERAPSALPRLTVEQMYAGIYPEQPGDFLLGGNTPNLPTIAPAAGISPYQVGQIGVPAMPEIPGAPRTRMASAAPFPMPRPSFMPAVGTALSVQPMPPMPIPRPGIGGPFRVAPVPAPRSQRPGLFRIGGFELPQLPTQARSVAGRTAMIDAPLQRVFNGGGRQNTAAVQSYRNEGMSPSQSYAAANNAATERAIANARDPEAARRLNSR